MFEVRDQLTFIPVLAIQMRPGCEADRALLAQAGYGLTGRHQSTYIRVVIINGGSGLSECDPYDWPGARTMPTAHTYIIEHFDTLESGAVIDVEFILGETAAPKAAQT